jgi:hypothetical protein
MQMYAHPPTDDASRAVLLELLQAWIQDLVAVVGDRALAERACSLMDGLALDILIGLPGRTPARALRIARDSIRWEVERTGRPLPR